MKEYDVSLAIKIGWDIFYWDEAYIFADSESEAVEVAKVMAMEDIGVNSAMFDEGNITVCYVHEVGEVEE